MCIILRPDIIVAAEISEYWTYLNFVEETPQLALDKLFEFDITIQNCLARQERSKRMGLGNVIAQSTEEYFREYFERSGLFIQVNENCYRLKKECQCLIPVKTLQNDLSDIEKLLGNIIINVYRCYTLEALNVM